eukprot:c19702_g1_i1 orf=133-1512(-)
MATAHESVKLLRKSMVAPATPTPLTARSLPLSHFDLIMRNFQYNQRILLYSLDYLQEQLAFGSIVEKLKSSLSQTLVHFYPLAGTLTFTEEHLGGRLEVLCNDTGVEFIEAFANVSVEEMLDRRKPPVLHELAPRKGAMNMDGTDIPLLIVQVTQLGGTGLAIGLTINHMLCDGYSLWHFMTSWAQLCNGDSSIVLPIFDRSLIESEHPEPMPKSKEKTFQPSISSFSEKKVERIVQSPLLQERVFHFSATDLADLKLQANMDRKGGKPYSTFAVLTSRLWKLISNARGLGDEEVTAFKLAIDCRKRLLPVVPQAYFGNGVHAIGPKAVVKDLKVQSLSHVASLVSDAVHAYENDSIRKSMYELNQRGPNALTFSMWGKNDVAVSSYFHFPAYKTDFGWGKPVGVRSGLGNKCDGKITFFPGREGDGSVDAEVMLYGDAMERFEKLMSSKPLPSQNHCY